MLRKYRWDYVVGIITDSATEFETYDTIEACDLMNLRNLQPSENNSDDWQVVAKDGSN